MDGEAFIASFVPAFLAERLASGRDSFCEEFPAAVLMADIAGFTPLCEGLCREGASGIERLTQVLNECLGRLVDTVLSDGGDVVKFAGDALIALWPGTDLDQARTSAVRCAAEALSRLDGCEVAGGHRLRLHVGVGAGRVRAATLGGTLLLLDGEAVVQAAVACKAPTSSEVAGALALPSVGVARATRAADAPAGLREYVPRIVLERLEAGQTEWLGELRSLTVLFVGLGHGVAPAEIERVLRALDDRDATVLEVLSDDGGVTVLVAFGLPPRGHENDPSRGVEAALSLADLGLPCKLGLATGRAFCGTCGNDRRRNYTILGEVVNRAARLMQTRSPYPVCDDATRRGAASRYRFDSLGAVDLKGMACPVAIFRPVGKQAFRPTAVPLVGRRRELELLADRLAARRGGAVMILGEAGLGKSRFVEELQGGVTSYLRAEADALERTTPYFAWRPVFERMLGAGPGLLDRVLQLLPERAELAPLLGCVLPLDLPETRLTEQMTGQVRADNTRDLLCDLLLIDPPDLVVLEDAHWADSASLALAGALPARRSDLLLVLTSRLAEPPLPFPVEVLRLEPLTRVESAALACERLRVSEIPDEMVDLIWERAAGNPFFTEELAFALCEAGAVEVRAGRCIMRGNLQATDCPTTIEGVITSRLDRLPVPLQLVVKVASVVGRVFTPPPLQAIHPIPADRPKVPQHLVDLGGREIVQEVREVGHVFRHALIGDVAYNMVLPTQRRKLHRALAEWVEELHPGGTPRTHALLAHHWLRAEDRAKTLEYLEKAGYTALQEGAYQEAAQLLEAALERCTSEPDLRIARIQSCLGKAYLGLGLHDRSESHMLAVVRRLGRPMPRGALLQAVGLVWECLRRLAARAATEVHDPVALEAADAYGTLAQLYYFENQNLPPAYATFRGLNLADAAGGLTGVRVCAHANASVILDLVPLHRAAGRYAQRAVALAQEADDLRASGYALMLAAMHAVGLGRWSEAGELLEGAIAASSRLGDWLRCGEARSIQGMMHFYTGRFERTLELYDELAEVAARSGNRLHQAWRPAGRAGPELSLGWVEDAIRDAEEGIQKLAALGSSPIDELRLHAVLGLARLRAGDREAARQCADRTDAMIRKHSPRPVAYYTMDGYAGAAEIYLALEDLPRAVRSCRDLETFATIFPMAAPRALLHRGSLQWLQGARDWALGTWARAEAAAVKLSLPWERAMTVLERGRRTGSSAEPGLRLLQDLGVDPEPWRL